MAGPVPVTSIGPTGALAPGFAAVLTAVQQNYQSIYGSDVDLSPDTQDGQLTSILSAAISDLCDLAVDVWAAYSPATAQGNGLSSAVKINGISRMIATNSTVSVTCVGQNVLVNGAQVTDAAGNVWTAPAFTIPGGGSINVTFTCQTLGAIALGSGVALTISAPTPGWQSATTAGAALPGQPVESDAALRQRQSASTALPAQTPAAATLGAVLNLPGVTRATYDENAGGAADTNGVPAHSVAFVVEGGVAQSIANAIALKKTQGTGTSGSTATTVQDQYGITKTINWSVLAYQPIYISVALTHLTGYVASTATLIQQVLVAAINGLPISSQNNSNVTIGPIVRYSKLWDAVNLSGDLAVTVTGLTQTQLDALSLTYDVGSLFIGTAPGPAGVANISVAWGSAAQTDLTKVLVA